MRALLVVPLLLLAAPALAQEDGDEDVVVETKADDAWVEARVKEMLADDAGKRKAAIDALAGTDPEKVVEVLRRVLEARGPRGDNLVITPHVKSARGVLVLDPLTGSSEVIRGSADGYDYTLESAGDGRYTLRAKRIGEDGRTLEEFVRSGTLKELQEKHPFLKFTLGVQMFDGTRARREAIKALGLPGDGAAGWTVWPTDIVAATHSFGLSVQPPPEALGFHLQLPEGAGLLLERVAPGSTAEKLGLRRFDILLRIDGELVDSPRQLAKLEGRGRELEIIRRGEKRKIDLAATPEER